MEGKASSEKPSGDLLQKIKESASVPSSPSGKRSRDSEDEVYVDNLHTHKRYLSEIMASSLNCLSVGDTITENLMYSPARDEVALQYSPMSEDSEDSRLCDNNSSSSSMPTSPVSPYRRMSRHHHRNSNSDTDARFPSSPSDICHSADLRRTALLRSLQMKTHPSATKGDDDDDAEEERGFQIEEDISNKNTKSDDDGIRSNQMI